ncbi:MAG: hypothetical protein IPK15_23565 [Verrucomicrobia bacterium]|nr:hypothetical protein [Verrucomicrobiota bacterium]
MGQPDQLVVDGGRADNLGNATPIVTVAGGTVTQVGDDWFADRSTRHLRGIARGQEIVFGTNSSQRFRVIDNRGDHIFFDPSGGRLSDFLAVGMSWRAETVVGRVTVRGGSTVELVDSGLNRGDRRGRLSAGDIELSDNAWLTHPFATTVSQFGIELTVANTLTISTNSRIDASARGYLGGLRDGNAANAAGRTLGNTTVGGSLRRNGGSYGGVGGFGSAEAFANAVYGSFRDRMKWAAAVAVIPIRLVTAVVGAHQRGDAESGGQILANGGAAAPVAGGSGGGIKITAGTLSGGGSMQAIGGSTGSGQPGGGGGGRIAGYYGRCKSLTWRS